MRHVLTSLLSLALLSAVAWAAVPASNTPPTGSKPSGASIYLSRYQVANSPAPVYGLFDLGKQSSLRLICTTGKGGKLRFMLNGRYFNVPMAKPFSVHAQFSNAAGQAISQTQPILFKAPQAKPMATWFIGLENVAGMYGSQPVEVAVPPGTAVIDLLGDDSSVSFPSNWLVGYIGQIQLFETP